MISRLLVQISLQGVPGVSFWPNVINEVNLSGIRLELNLGVFHLDIVSIVANKLHHRSNQVDTQRWAQVFNRFHIGQLMPCVVRFQIETCLYQTGKSDLTCILRTVMQNICVCWEKGVGRKCQFVNIAWVWMLTEGLTMFHVCLCEGQHLLFIREVT